MRGASPVERTDQPLIGLIVPPSQQNKIHKMKKIGTIVPYAPKIHQRSWSYLDEQKYMHFAYRIPTPPDLL